MIAVSVLLLPAELAEGGFNRVVYYLDRSGCRYPRDRCLQPAAESGHSSVEVGVTSENLMSRFEDVQPQGARNNRVKSKKADLARVI